MARAGATRALHLLGARGLAALEAAFQARPLLAFDFDGTLAPLVARREDARVADRVAEGLARLAEELPVAILTGRRVADVRGRLGFTPRFIVGNHGAEDGRDPAALVRLAARLDPWRSRLRAAAPTLAADGVEVEDKGASIAVHYRRASRPRAALAHILALGDPPDAAVRLTRGKRVVNLTAAGAPDKAEALRGLVRRSGATRAVFAGDDLNDEPVFLAAQPGWLTVRIGARSPPRGAHFYLQGPEEVPAWLERMLALLE
jgi:trehalose 6-phosphate phosphatase